LASFLAVFGSLFSPKIANVSRETFAIFVFGQEEQRWYAMMMALCRAGGLRPPMSLCVPAVGPAGFA